MQCHHSAVLSVQERLLMLGLVFLQLMQLIDGNRQQQQQQRRKVSVLFAYEQTPSPPFSGSTGAAALQLYWRSSNGREKPWGAPMLPGLPGQGVSSFVGDVWVVKNATSSELLHSVVLTQPEAGSQRLRVDVATGVISSAPSNVASNALSAAHSGQGSDVWGVEVDLGTDYGFEFSPKKLAAERRVTLTRAYSRMESAHGPVEASAYGLELSEEAVVKHFTPPGLRPKEEARLVVGSRVVAIDGVPVEHKLHDGANAEGFESAREQVHELLRRVVLPAGESVWTVVIPPEHVQPHRARGLRLDNPYVPPRSRQLIGDQSAAPRGLGSWEQWEVDNPQYLAQVYSTDPTVRTYDGFFTAEQCAEVQSSAAPAMRRASVASTTGTCFHSRRFIGKNP
jgi:hypothetical protein